MIPNLKPIFSDIKSQSIRNIQRKIANFICKIDDKEKMEVFTKLFIYSITKIDPDEEQQNLVSKYLLNNYANYINLNSNNQIILRMIYQRYLYILFEKLTKDYNLIPYIIAEKHLFKYSLLTRKTIPWYDNPESAYHYLLSTKDHTYKYCNDLEKWEMKQIRDIIDRYSPKYLNK